MNEIVESRFCAGCGTPLVITKRPGPPQKWCSEQCRKAHYLQRDPCVDCGAPTSSCSRNGFAAEPRCIRCAAIHAHAPQRAQIERMWAEGRTCREIGETLGWTGEYLTHGITILRGRGYNLPHRRTPAQVARITAGSGERLRKAQAAQKAAV